MHGPSCCLLPFLKTVCCRLSAVRCSLVAINDSSAVQVVGTQFHGHAVAGQNTNEVLPHPSRNMGQHLVIVLELDLEHGVGQRLGDHRHYLNRVFLRQTASNSAGAPISASSLVDRACYSVKTLAPVAVTATVCSK